MEQPPPPALPGRDQPPCLPAELGTPIWAIGTTLFFAMAAALIAPPSQPAHAQAAGAGRIAFDIPAQPLDAALARYFQLTGVQLLYDSAVTRGRRSSAVRGSYAPREALRLLLAGTGLVARYSGANAVFIRPASPADDSPLVPLGRVVVRERAPVALPAADRLAYYSRLEEQLQTLLRADPRTGRLSFSVTVELRVNAEGRIAGLAIRQGSGRRTTDAALVAVLDGASAPPPPPGLVQPLAITLAGKPR
ncbi:STN domain-containing protein [Sphingomonas sp. H39-1-10]|uniref:STN domain-containing protein n=1 Tax=Sphingomonas pollutisoli TaxID=3030829 RepID=UPI0023B8A54A|nr:STN domain-containing protein [Sphingomonas pollutisoli]MDF0490363.1 STN domain-containing protein [Sphingomonas pollutisoli]